MINTSAISLKTINLTVGYHTKQGTNALFKNLVLNLTAGELVCFMGPNGIGKSTLIRTLAGLQKPLAGQAAYSALNAKDSSKQVAVVLTDKINGGLMTAYDIVALGRYPYLNWSINLTAADRAIIDRAISQVHIEYLRDAKVLELSDGQLQMVMLARALAQDTPVILLDEPTAHLDLNNRVEIMKLLRHLAKETNKSILVSTHDLDLALQLADRIWLANHDKQIITGLPEDLILNGVFDSIFQFKGFDLKTGKVKHDLTGKLHVQLKGVSGPELLWTKNALERSDISISAESSIDITVKIGDKVFWEVVRQGVSETFATLEEAIHFIYFGQTFAK